MKGYRIGGWIRLAVSMILAAAVGRVQAQTVSFNFSATSATWSGWVNVAGNPSQAVQTATANGVTISSVAAANWSPYNGTSAANGSGFYPGTYYPARVMSNNWYNYNGTTRSLALYNSLAPQIELSGLNPDSTYTLVISGSDGGSLVTNPTQYTVAGKTNYGSQNLSVHNNSANGVIFQAVTPDSTGLIRIYINATTSTDLATICGIQVYPGYVGVSGPGVVIKAPSNGTLLAEGTNVTIQALSQEVNGTIAKVEFYSDTMKIGEVDAAPYNFTWADPEPGVYTITAKATDNQGTVNSASVSIGINSLNYFWSTTGNVGNNADSTFAGNTDSVRLDFRTKNIQRMSISPIGNIGIGTITPTAQLHVTASIRLAGLVHDSIGVYPRTLVSDSFGNIAYRPITDIVAPVGGGLGVTEFGALALGDSSAGFGAHSFMTKRYQNLNSYYYSIGGSLNDPVNAANFRWYNNGDLVSGTTMDLNVNTMSQPGLRFYNKLGTLELGATDRLDTLRSPIVTGNWHGSGLHINSVDSNSGDPKMINTLYLGFFTNIDTSVVLQNSLLAVQDLQISNSGSLINTLHLGGSAALTAPVSNSVIGGYEGIDAPTSASIVIGSNLQIDTTAYSTIAGWENSFSGMGQLVGGAYLSDRTPFGSAFGLNNVDFVSLPWTSTKGMATSGVAGYPLLAIGNSAAVSDTQSSNAVTILYTGRTQINATGFGTGLTQAAATPKAALEVMSTNSGVLVPRLSTSLLHGIVTQDLQNGLLLYNTDSATFQYYNGIGWSTIGSPSGSNMGGWGYGGNTGTNAASNFMGTSDTTQLVFRTNNTPQMTILSNGGVGIGTSVLPASDAELAVDGASYSSKVIVTLTGWPDYVFDKAYSLPSLDKIKRYIRRNGHLPGVITASEASAKGLDLGKNEAELLKKVEELTLYLIEARKQSETRQKEIDRLKEQNQTLADHQREIDQLRSALEKISAKH